MNARAIRFAAVSGVAHRLRRLAEILRRTIALPFDPLVRLVARAPVRLQIKLLIAFLTIIVLLVGLGAVGLRGLTTFNERTERLITAEHDVAVYREAQRDTRRQLYELYQIDSALMVGQQQTLTDALFQLTRFRQDLFELLGTSVDNTELVRNLEDAYDHLLSSISRVAALSGNGDTTQSWKLERSTVQPQAQRVQQLSDALLQRGEAERDLSIRQRDATYRAALTVVAGFALASILLALVLGRAISLSVTRPVGDIEAHLERIAAGEFRHSVIVANRDELGALAANVNRTSEALGQAYGELAETLERQTATAEILQVINSSPGQLAPVFDAMLEKVMALCDAAVASIFTFDGVAFRIAAGRGLPPAASEFLRNPFRPTEQDGPLSGLVAGEPLIHIADLTKTGYHLAGASACRAMADSAGARTALWIALRKDDVLIGAFVLCRPEVRPFSDKQIGVVESFAAQAVVAIDNTRLLNEIRAARDAAEKALSELRQTQQQLVVQQKMAALGQLTAGIAHEIKNPLNFVNNFAGLSVELLDELKAAAAPGIAMLDEDVRTEIDETIEMLTGNLEKIAEHGRRADGIVKSMLAHSRGSSGERQQVDLNALVEEALNLAYHGARAQDQNFNITLERDFASGIAPIELVPQDVTRVFLNLIGNGFYAANKRKQQAGDAGFRPVLRVRTRDLGELVEVAVRDNGTGIPPELRDRLFQPFFTTKPTGEGTGLGLSISYDIVAQQHGGTISVDSEPGHFTEFTIRLPRRFSSRKEQA